MPVPALVVGLARSLAGSYIKGKVTDMAGIDIMRAIAELIPGEQPFLGETQGAQGIMAALGNALGALIPGIQTSLGEGVPGIPAGMIVKSWTANGAPFHMLRDGRIAVRRKNGIWRIYRPAKNIVISRNPRVSHLIKADKLINKYMTTLQKRMPAARRRSRSRVNVSAGDINAIRGLLTAGR